MVKELRPLFVIKNVTFSCQKVCYCVSCFTYFSQITNLWSLDTYIMNKDRWWLLLLLLPWPPGYMQRKTLPSSSAWARPEGVSSPPHLRMSKSDASRGVSVIIKRKSVDEMRQANSLCYLCDLLYYLLTMLLTKYVTYQVCYLRSMLLTNYVTN